MHSCACPFRRVVTIIVFNEPRSTARLCLGSRVCGLRRFRSFAKAQSQGFLDQARIRASWDMHEIRLLVNKVGAWSIALVQGLGLIIQLCQS